MRWRSRRQSKAPAARWLANDSAAARTGHGTRRCLARAGVGGVVALSRASRSAGLAWSVEQPMGSSTRWDEKRRAATVTSDLDPLGLLGLISKPAEGTLKAWCGPVERQSRRAAEAPGGRSERVRSSPFRSTLSAAARSGSPMAAIAAGLAPGLP